MNDDIIKSISNEINKSEKHVKIVLEMLEEGNTVPFIARYRKEATGAMTEDEIRKISEVYEYQVNLLKRKEDVIRLIDEKGLMNDELRDKIMKAEKLVDVEDLYRPYKEKKKTKATDAINNGLEPLAKMIMSFPVTGDINSMASKYVNDKVESVDKAIEGAGYIIAEWISDNAYYPYKNGLIVTKVKKDNSDTTRVYEMYYNYSEKVNEIKPHRVLAINRAEKEKVIGVNIDVNVDDIISFLECKIIKNDRSFVCSIIKNSIIDSYKRLISGSIEREIRSELKEISEQTKEIFETKINCILLDEL